jgi:hypothetical protein
MFGYLFGLILAAGTVVSVSEESQSAAAARRPARASDLVQQLGQFRASLPATGRSAALLDVRGMPESHLRLYRISNGHHQTCIKGIDLGWLVL